MKQQLCIYEIIRMKYRKRALGTVPTLKKEKESKPNMKQEINRKNQSSNTN